MRLALRVVLPEVRQKAEKEVGTFWKMNTSRALAEQEQPLFLRLPSQHCPEIAAPSLLRKTTNSRFIRPFINWRFIRQIY